ncbi:unnamed protein product [Boreogadus saida]
MKMNCKLNSFISKKVLFGAIPIWILLLKSHPPPLGKSVGCILMKTIAGLQDLPPFSSRCLPPHQEQDLHLLTQSKTSTSSPRARPPPPRQEQDLHLLAKSQTSTSSPRARPPPPRQEQDLHLLAKSKTSTSSPRARPPPPHQEQDLHLLTQSQTSTSCQKSSRTEACGARVDWRLRLETRGLQHRTRGPGLWLRRADGGAKTLEDDITLPSRILESGLEKPYIWKANPEDNQNSTIKDSSNT